MKREILDRIFKTGIVPVVRAESAADALAVVDVILAGGIDVIEVTMTVPGAVEVIDQIVGRHGDAVVVGAGTVLERDTARACVKAGASFVVSPTLDEGTVDFCRTEDVAVMPGALTPTEVVRAWRAGADVVKVFPCGAVGGASYIRALKAPLPQIPLMPTGGVAIGTVGDFIRAGACAVGAGADLVDLGLLREGNGEAITLKARAYVEAIWRARGGVG
jgi:2-dehydro-3-deoxyphosphogluconate aldolase/(4S)-4-hydroxy-2-oxoglutarate aldolase